MIYIVSHKEVPVFTGLNYIPIQVGYNPNNYKRYVRDNTGQNIASKNAYYCELTALYWIWKNDTSDEKGLVHYRRYFAKNMWNNSATNIYGYDELHSLMKNADIILPKRTHYHVSAKEQLCRNSCDYENFNVLKQVVSELEPEYMDTFCNFFNQNRCSQYNMMFCSAQIFNDYCEWLFKILFEVEDRIDIEKLHDYKKRIFGFLSERLLNIWVEKNRLEVRYVDVINTENSMLCNLSFMRREFTNEIRYLFKH